MTLVIDAVGARVGGNITILNNILYYLSTIDSELHFIVYIEKTSLEKYFIYINKNITIKTVNDKSLVKKIFWQQFKLHKIAKEHNAQVILSITNIVSFFPRVPQVVYFHQALLFITNQQLFNFFGLSNIIRFKVLKIFVVLGFLKADAIVVQTDYIKQRIVTELPGVKAKVHRVYSGIPKIFDNRISELTFSEHLKDEFKILYIAHPAEYKNFDILFEAAKLAKEKKIFFKFLLTLDKSSSDSRYQSFIDEYVQKISEYGIEDYFYFLGSLKNHAEIEYAYLFTDIVIHPSFVESFPQTFTEAMQYGKPLISVDLPYAREIGENASLYFNVEDPLTLLDGLEKYITNKKLLVDMSLKSKKRIKFFDPMTRWTSLYNIIKNV